MTGARPEIAACPDAQTFRQWYYLKSELMDFARARGIKTTGGKFEIADRIAHFLDHGVPPRETRPARPGSTFDWHAASLGPETRITDNYRNTQNVRRFLADQLGPGFKFSIPLMDWARAHVGATLADLAEAAGRIAAEKAAGVKAPDQPHNQYNAYTRAYFAHCPEGSMEELRRLWALRRARPGPYVFAPGDLALLPARGRPGD